MLADYPVYATLPTADVERLRPFYEETLGFQVLQANPGGITFQAGEGTYFAITQSSGEASGSHTQMGFAVTDIDKIVAELHRRGVVFQAYETPKTVDGVADMPGGRAAWLKDPDGNLIGMIELRGVA